MVLIFIYILKFKMYIFMLSLTGYAHLPRHAILTVYSIQKL